MTSTDDSPKKVPQRWTAGSVNADMWVDADQDPRESGAQLMDERSTLLDYLRSYRLTLEMKCADLDESQMARRSVPPSTMSLLGLIRHMADVERYWFRFVMGGEDAPKLYGAAEDREAAFGGAVGDADVVDEAWRAWRAEVVWAEDLASQTSDLGTTGTTRQGQSIQLREVLVHMIEEYARHCGHADLLRERIDGRTGQ